MRLAAGVGVLIVVAHAAGFVWLAQRNAGTELTVEVRSPLASVQPSLDGEVPAAIAARVETRTIAAAPGLMRKHWSVSYRGGFMRDVGATQLVGPFQDPALPACSGRVVLGQRLLDDGDAGPDTIAGIMKQMIETELKGQNIFPVGNYKKVKSLKLEWARLEARPFDRGLVGKEGAPDGYVRASARVAFDRVEVPVIVALIPERDATSLKFRIRAFADLDFDNRVFNWVSDKVGADGVATRIARDQIDDVLITTFAPPPPFEISDGQTLNFTYCDGPIEIADAAYGTLPFAVTIKPLAGQPLVLPPRFGPGARQQPSANTALAIDLDVDALNAMLFELWRTGWLDQRVAEVGLDARFNTDPIVTEYLSIRISPLVLALPPVIAPGPDGTLRLSADARLAINDGKTTTTGRVFGALVFRFAPAPGRELPLAVDLGLLELACERTSTTLVPCYSDLVATIRDRGSEFHGALTEAFASLLADIFVDRRLGATGLPADLVIRSAVPSLTEGGTLHLELDAKLVPVP